MIDRPKSSKIRPRLSFETNPSEANPWRGFAKEQDSWTRAGCGQGKKRREISEKCGGKKPSNRRVRDPAMVQRYSRERRNEINRSSARRNRTRARNAVHTGGLWHTCAHNHVVSLTVCPTVSVHPRTYVYSRSQKCWDSKF